MKQDELETNSSDKKKKIAHSHAYPKGDFIQEAKSI